MKRTLYIIVVLFIVAVAVFYFSSFIQAAIMRVANIVRVESGLVGYWTFDGPTINWATGQVTDSSGNSATGQLSRFSTSTSPVLGVSGQAFRFFPVAANQINITDGTGSALDTINDNMSLSLWIKPLSATQNNPNNPMRKNASGGTSGFGLESSAGNISYYFFMGNGGLTCYSNAFTLTNQVWTHVVVVKNGTTRTVYQNGALDSNGTCTTAGQTITDNNDPLTIGNYEAAGRNSFNGLIDEFRIYNRALSSGEIQYLYQKNAREFGSKIGVPITSATGGTITKSGNYTIHTFTSSGTFTPNKNMSVDVLVVAGGGAGGGNVGGGGGAGGYQEVSGVAVTATGYTITVGAGGTPGGDGNGTTNGSPGSNSSALGTTSLGGGGGRSFNAAAPAAGGSGGGGSGDSDAGIAGTAGQGNNGGSGANNGSAYGGGGGGGASAVGADATATQGGVGGAGDTSTFSGSAVTRAGGGGGGGYQTPTVAAGAGGSGGGGAGNAVINGPGTAGTANTGGGGGGGAGGGAGVGGAGGSGVIIIRYKSVAIINASQENKIPGGLVGSWNFNGPNINWVANQATDVSNNSATGQMIGFSTSTSPVPGISGQGLNFNGSNYIDITNIPNIPSGTMSMWIYPKALPISTDRDVLITFYENGETEQFGTVDKMIWLTSTTVKGNIYDGSYKVVSATSNIQKNTWNLVTLTWNGTTETIYLNGIAEGSIAAGTSFNFTNANARLAGIPGAVSDGETTRTRFIGYMDEPRVYNRALSSGEVQALYLSGAR